MKKIVIFGNSGSGKSTLAKTIVELEGVAHLDLDTIAWKPQSPPERLPINESIAVIHDFVESNISWVIEGCYSDLLAFALSYANEIIFLNLSVESCIKNAKRRAWEPHKYKNKDAQDANLPMLLDWISQYYSRDDTFSKSAHESLFNNFEHKKSMYINNECDNYQTA